MDFSLTDEQLELQRTLRAVTADQCSSARLREVMATESAQDEELWGLVATELGLLGVAVAEDAGGIGGSFVDAAVVIEESGRGLWPTPLVAALSAVSALPAGDESLPSLSMGEQRATLVVADQLTVRDGKLSGDATHVVGAEGADLFVVATRDGLYAAEAAQAAVVSSAGLDPLRRLSTVSFAGVSGRSVGDPAAAGRAIDVLRVALAIEAVGVAVASLESTVAYLKTREQFGKPIGSFQALAHRAADLAVDLAAATSTAYYAAWVVDGAPDELSVVAPLAKAVCADAAYRITADAIQLHGGIGFTWEHDAHLYFKRATSTRMLLGDSHKQRQLVAERARLFA